MGTKEDFIAMRKKLSDEDAKREELIIAGRKLLTLAKKAIYNTHRNELEQAQKVLDAAKPFADLLKNSTPRQYNRIGAVRAALQEWAESLAYFTYAKESRLLSIEEAGLEIEDYLLAIVDLTGELTRRAVLSSIDKKNDTVKHIRDFVDVLFGEFLSFDFRNSELRKKTDQMRWNVQKIEELLVRSS